MTKTTVLGSDAQQITVGKIGHGLMLMTWSPNPVTDEDAFESIKASLDSVPPGAKMILNSGEFYGINPREANLELVARFFEKYPEYADKAFLSGGTKPDSLEPDCSPQNLKRSVDCVLDKLRGTKKVDLFQCARVDRKVPIEDVIKTLSGYATEGKFDYIGMSECRAETLERANAVHPIAIVEIEVSPWSYTQETKDVISKSKQLNINVCAYSPLGRGFLTGKWKSPEDMHPSDSRKKMTRFHDENFKHNLAIVDGLKTIAENKGITPAQLCIAWVSSLGPHVIPIPGSSHKTRTVENMKGGEIDLLREETEQINGLVNEFNVKGDRYFGNDEAAHLWG